MFHCLVASVFNCSQMPYLNMAKYKQNNLHNMVTASMKSYIPCMKFIEISQIVFGIQHSV